MKQQLKVKYFSPEQAKYINPDLIDFVTLNNGSMVKLDNVQKCSQKVCQNPGVCKKCGKVKYMGQTNNFSSSSYVFRGGKKKGNEAEASGIEVSPEGIKTENLKGAEGALLTDILTGGYNFGDDQNENQEQIPQEQGYYEGDQQGTAPQQYVPVPEQNQSPDGGYTNEYVDPNQYYPGEQNQTTNIDEAIRYGPSDNPQEQPKGVQEEYVNPEIPNENYPPQDYPLQPEEQIPVQAPYIPVKPVSEQPVNPVQEPVIPVQPIQPYQQPSQPQPYPNQQPTQPQPYPNQQPTQPQPYPNQQPTQPQNQPYQQPMEQPFIPPQVIPASNAAKTNAPVQQTNNNTSAPKTFKDYFKEAKKKAKEKKKNTVFRARRKEVQSNICPKCHLPKEILCPDCQRKDDESRLNSQRNTQKEDQQKDNENPQKDDKDNNNEEDDKRSPQIDDNKNNRINNQGNDNNRRNNQGNDIDNNYRRNPQRGDNNRRNNQGNDKDNNNRRNPQRDDNNRRNNQGNDNNRRNNQGNDNNRRNNQGNDNNRRNDYGNSRRKSQDDSKKNDFRNVPLNGRRSDNKKHLRGNSDNKYNSRTFEKRMGGEYDMDLDNYRYYATNNTTMENRRTITIVKRGDIIIAEGD